MGGLYTKYGILFPNHNFGLGGRLGQVDSLSKENRIRNNLGLKGGQKCKKSTKIQQQTNYI